MVTYSTVSTVVPDQAEQLIAGKTVKQINVWLILKNSLFGQN